jgi:signal transduction histidine kinase
LTTTVAGSVAAAEVLVRSHLGNGIGTDGAGDAAALRALGDDTADLLAMSEQVRLQLAQSAITGPALLDLAAEEAVVVTIGVLHALTPTRQLSLWEADDAGTPTCAAHAGPRPSRRTAELAGHTLALSGRDDSTGLLVGVAIVGSNHPPAALMARPEPGHRVHCDTFLREIAPFMRGLLVRKSLTERAATTERVLTSASERRLSRLAFDLHDGALQNLAAVTGDIAMLRRRVQSVLPDGESRRQVRGCIDDVDTHIRAIGTELRDLCHALQSPVMPRASFARILHAELEAFGRRTDIRSRLEVEGDVDDLTDSQRIAIWRIVQESLANAREHSSARNVKVSLVAADDALQLDVTDDGRGFDVPATLLDAARRGRMGLVGVSERARLLGGTCHIRSAPGGPTTVSVTLARWRRNLDAT